MLHGTALGMTTTANVSELSEEPEKTSILFVKGIRNRLLLFNLM
jgi:hypothetical protein